MFPITHIWFAEKVLGCSDSSTTLGAVFPDIVITGCLDYKQTHYCGWSLYDYLLKVNENFAKAMATHIIKPEGLDYYGDECYKTGYKGYCFQKGKLIEEQVIRACNIPEEFGLWKAHNFVEMGIELNIIESCPDLTSRLHEALNDKIMIAQIGKALDSFFSLREGRIADCFEEFSRYIVMQQSDSYLLAQKYDLQMQAKHNISIDIREASKIITHCRELVKSDIDEFMNDCSYRVCNMLEGGDCNR